MRRRMKVGVMHGSSRDEWIGIGYVHLLRTIASRMVEYIREVGLNQ